MMAAFAGYGFPKAHAASYAKVAWRSAWCKAHFPAEFMAALLANWGGYYSQSVYLGEACRLGLTVQPPHVNYSSRNFVAASPEAGGKVLFMGLDQIRNMTGRTIGRILHGRPFYFAGGFPDPRRSAHPGGWRPGTSRSVRRLWNDPCNSAAFAKWRLAIRAAEPFRVSESGG